MSSNFWAALALPLAIVISSVIGVSESKAVGSGHPHGDRLVQDAKKFPSHD
jgi:hypothetical protein